MAWNNVNTGIGGSTWNAIPTNNVLTWNNIDTGGSISTWNAIPTNNVPWINNLGNIVSWVNNSGNLVAWQGVEDSVWQQVPISQSPNWTTVPT